MDRTIDRRSMLRVLGVGVIGTTAGCNALQNGDKGEGQSNSSPTETNTTPGPSTNEKSGTDETTSGSSTVPSTLQTKVAPENAAEGSPQEFGSSVALDEGTLLVGAPFARDGGGAAYIFINSNGVWEQQAKLLPTDGDGNDKFGTSVALNGKTAAISSPVKEAGGGASSIGPGAVYVFTQSGDQWTQQAKLTPENAEGEARFGSAIDISDDTILIGAKLASAAYLYSKTNDGWTQSEVLSKGKEDAKFGADVAIENNTILVGSPDQRLSSNAPTYFIGAVHVYKRSAGSWSHQARLSDDTGESGSGDKFGSAVDLSGDTALIGSSGENDPNGGNAGAAYIYTNSNGSWEQTKELIPSNGQSDNYFGFSASLDDDLALIGTQDSNQVYLFTRSESWSEEEILTPADAEDTPKLNFGNAVALSNGIAAIGAPFRYRVGSTYVYH